MWVLKALPTELQFQMPHMNQSQFATIKLAELAIAITILAQHSFSD
jgi:hypothetical protein